MNRPTRLSDDFLTIRIPLEQMVMKPDTQYVLSAVAELDPKNPGKLKLELVRVGEI